MATYPKLVIEPGWKRLLAIQRLRAEGSRWGLVHPGSQCKQVRLPRRLETQALGWLGQRDNLVHARVSLVNAVHGQIESLGHRVPKAERPPVMPEALHTTLAGIPLSNANQTLV